MTRHMWDHAEWRKSSRSNGAGNCVEVAVAPAWRKSSRSGGNGNCVEVAVAPGWRKSSRSNGAGDCVEVAEFESLVGVRDSKDPAGPILAVTPGDWTAFLAGIHDGDFDTP